MQNPFLNYFLFFAFCLSILSSCQKEETLSSELITNVELHQKQSFEGDPSALDALLVDDLLEFTKGEEEDKSLRTLVYSEVNSVGLGQWRGLWFNRDNLPDPMNYKYEVELYTQSGDPDLYIYGYNTGQSTWRQVRSSTNPGGQVDQTSFRQTGLTFEENRAYVGVYGFYSSTYEIRIYRSPVDCQEYPPAEICYEFQVYPLPTYCGCDGKTYHGYCGPFMAGVTSYTDGHCGGNGGGGSMNVASFPYFTNFNSLGNEWRTESSSSVGRIQTTSEYGPYSGQHLVMDVSSSGNWNRNRLDLHIDLYNATSWIDLNFKFKDFSDEFHQEDGVYFSDDGGENFIKVFAINPNEFVNHQWHDFTLYVEQLIANYGLEFSSNFVIRIQQFDNYRATTDGFAIDNLEVKSAFFSDDNYRKKITQAVIKNNEACALMADQEEENVE